MQSFPFTEVKPVERWSNFHGTVTARVETYCTPDGLGVAGDDSPRRFARHGQAIDAILQHCFAEQQPLRVLGAGWSLSKIVAPSAVVLDPANLNAVLKVRAAWIEPAYRVAKPDRTLIFAQAGATISSLNRRLGEVGLALQTSGASDGHRVAGCIATGSHGSAIDVGAVHDTVRAIHLVTAPGRAVFLQPGQGAACTDDVADWLARETGIPTRSVRDDRLFAAALVALGSLGVVHGVVIEAVPLYRLRRRKLAFGFDDAALWQAVRTLDTRALHPDRPDRPYHFEVVLQPYPEGGTNEAYAVMMWKEPTDGSPFAGPTPGVPELSNEVLDLITDLSGRLDGGLAGRALKKVVHDTLAGRYRPGDTAPRFPGQMFGWTSTPPGKSASTEIVVDHVHSRAAVAAIYDALHSHDARGELLLGAVALRFVPKSSAVLGMNIHPQNCFIELPSLRSNEVESIYASCYAALSRAAIPFTCHWGQHHTLDAPQLQRYFGDRPEHWRAARQELLPEAVARSVFASADLASLGLG